MSPIPLRETFEHAAARYHRARPGYPDELFDDLVELAELRPDSRILEIGPGTGRATEPLARRGFEIHGIELGEALAAEAQKNLSAYESVTIDVGQFETFPLDAHSYDLVMSPTAFHWVEQPTGYQRVAEALRPGGYFAEFRHYHVWSPESGHFFNATQEVYSQFGPDTKPVLRLPLPEEIETKEAEIEQSGLFGPTELRRYIQNVEHTAESYTDLLWTFSDHIAQQEPNRSNLIDGIAEVIRGLPGGRAIKTHLIILHVAPLRR